jgi:hypothetical protein
MRLIHRALARQIGARFKGDVQSLVLKGPAETREPEAVIADVRASLVETLLAADAATLAGLGADERVTVAVDFVAGGLFVANARPSRTLLVSVRGRDVAARGRGAISAEELGRRVEVSEY